MMYNMYIFIIVFNVICVNEEKNCIKLNPIDIYLLLLWIAIKRITNLFLLVRNNHLTCFFSLGKQTKTDWNQKLIGK